MTVAVPKKKPRLLVATSMFPRWENDSEPGFVFELCRRLTSRFDVIVIAPHAKGAALTETMDGVRVNRYRYAPAPIETLAYEGGIVPKLRRNRWKWSLVPLFIAFQFLCIRRNLRRWRPDAVHAHWILPQGLLCALAMRGNPWTALVVTAHGTDIFGLRSGLMQALKKHALRRAAAVTGVGYAMSGDLAKLGVDEQRRFIAPMGVDLTERFTPDATDRSHSEILFVGRLVDTKGVSFLIDAAPAILAAHPDARFTIVGFGPEEKRLREQVRSYGLVEVFDFVGRVASAELPAYYRRAAVFVAPFVDGKSGEQEGFGLVLVEAVGCGCPVAASSIPALRSLLDDDPEFLFEPRNGAAIARTVVRLLDTPSQVAERIETLRIRYRREFDWDIITARYAEIIEGVLST